MLVSPSLAATAASPHRPPPQPEEPDGRRAARRALPREAWSFALALAAVLVVKAGLLPSVPW